jgi:UDP-N-acetylglucosamine--dolichyl-phosphate N-acetylglucosaminephosphotransferase
MVGSGKHVQHPPGGAPVSIPVGLAATLSGAVVAFLCREAVVAGLQTRIFVAVALSAMAYLATARFIPDMAVMFARAGLAGRDINKKGMPGGSEPVPESLGLVCATVYLIVLCLLHSPGLRALDGEIAGEAHLYTAAMASVTFMVLLGFADDVLDLKWRYKLMLPLVASMPLLVNYSGSTAVRVPALLRPVAAAIAPLFRGGLVDDGGPDSRLVDIGLAYYIFMALLSIFCTNAINIYAGINGLEAGQAIVIAGFIIVHNALNFNPVGEKDNLDLVRANNAFSVELILPFAAVTLALLRFNWYPSTVFVGDTFCYFAGMTFAMASILGHYSETLLFFFIPQIINFVYSMPQLFGLVACPRHRLPTLNPNTGKLEAVPSHMNLVNLALMCSGPITEAQLCTGLLVFQAICCMLGLFVRASVLLFI